MSKQDDIRILLDEDPEARDLSHREIARRFSCDEGMVRRVRKVWEAERAAHNLARTDDTDIAEAVLANLLAAGKAEEAVLEALEEIKQETSDLKARLKAARHMRARAFATAEESFPLWEQHVKCSPQGPEEENGVEAGKPQLAGAG